MAVHRITATRIYISVKGLFGVEPIIYWRDAMSPLRAEVLSPDRKAQLTAIAPNEPARAAAIDLRRRLVDVMEAERGAHYQIGKYYPYKSALEKTTTWTLLSQLKSSLDPDDVMNPGALSLDPHSHFLPTRGDQS
jgi:FAD/FMN-containing dehydrogenase